MLARSIRIRKFIKYLPLECIILNFIGEMIKLLFFFLYMRRRGCFWSYWGRCSIIILQIVEFLSEKKKGIIEIYSILYATTKNLFHAKKILCPLWHYLYMMAYCTNNNLSKDNIFLILNLNFLSAFAFSFYYKFWWEKPTFRNKLEGSSERQFQHGRVQVYFFIMTLSSTHKLTLNKRNVFIHQA